MFAPLQICHSRFIGGGVGFLCQLFNYRPDLRGKAFIAYHVADIAAAYPGEFSYFSEVAVRHLFAIWNSWLLCFLILLSLLVLLLLYMLIYQTPYIWCKLLREYFITFL